jgi:hypothetical protein
MNFNETIKPKRSIGALRKANKTKLKSPDLAGQLKLQRHTAAAIVKQFADDHVTEVVRNIAGWKNHDHIGPLLNRRTVLHKRVYFHHRPFHKKLFLIRSDSQDRKVRAAARTSWPKRVASGRRPARS